jgi:hypothetical protein
MKYTWSPNRPTKPGYYWHNYDMTEGGDWTELVEIYLRLDGQLRVKYLEREVDASNGRDRLDKLLDDTLFDDDSWSEEILEPEWKHD